MKRLLVKDTDEVDAISGRQYHHWSPGELRKIKRRMRRRERRRFKQEKLDDSSY